MGRMSFMSRKKCIKKDGFEDLSTEFICAEGDKRGSAPCRGDSGSPLILSGGAEEVLIGILPANSVDARCRGDKPTPFVKIAAFLDWIKDNM